MSTVKEGRVAIFGLSHLLGDSKVSTVTGISGVRVAILVTVDAFELSDQFRSSKISPCRFLLSAARSCLRKRCYKYERGGWGGRSTPNLQNIEQDGKALLLAKSCKDLLAQTLHTGLGGRRPPICKTSSKMRTCRVLLSFARFCENMSFPAQRC